MESKILTNAFLEELRMESQATRKCLERIPTSSFKFKPHETSMEMGYLAQLVADIPLWIYYMLTSSEIDFATYPHAEMNTNSALVSHFDDSVRKAEIAFSHTDDEKLKEDFSLKKDGKILYTKPKNIDIGTTLNHWIHHRGQLTVYMRMNNIKIPSIYGPSGDEKAL